MTITGSRAPILVADENESDRVLIVSAIRNARPQDAILSISAVAEVKEYLFQEDRHIDPMLSPLPKLVILDVHTPLNDGLELMKEFIPKATQYKIPIVVLTSMTSDHVITSCQGLGVSTVIAKPFTLTDLYKVTKDICDAWL